MIRRMTVLASGMALATLVGCPSGNEGDSNDIGMNQGNRTQSGVPTDRGDGGINTFGGSIDSSVVEERFVELVNSARSVARRCGDGVFPAVGPVTWSERIEAAALKHSNDMASRNTLSHTGLSGSNVGSRLTAESYHWLSAGENIASGYPTPEGVVQGWLVSEGHCGNMMNASYTEMGVSSADTAGENPVRYWSQVLAQPNR